MFHSGFLPTYVNMYVCVYLLIIDTTIVAYSKLFSSVEITYI